MFKIYDKGFYFGAANSLDEAKEMISRLPGDFRIEDAEGNVIQDYHYKDME